MENINQNSNPSWHNLLRCMVDYYKEFLDNFG